MSQKVILTDEQIHHAIDGLIDYLEAFEQNINTLYKEWEMAKHLNDDHSTKRILEYKIGLQRTAAMKYLDTFYTLASYTVIDVEDRDGHPTGNTTFYCRGLTDEQFFSLQRSIEGFVGAPYPLAPLGAGSAAGHGVKPPKIEKILSDRYDKL